MSPDSVSWELRVTMSLERLMRDTNRGEEARATLADIYSWFTEGFDLRAGKLLPLSLWFSFRALP